VNWLRKLSERSAPAGLEWRLWRRLPAIFAWGTLLPVLGMAVAVWTAPLEPTAAQEREHGLLLYRLAGVVALHWTLVLTVAIGCVVVMIMKGPAYGADPYPPEGRDTDARDGDASDRDARDGVARDAGAGDAQARRIQNSSRR
jgi:hypothetical protein